MKWELVKGLAGADPFDLPTDVFGDFAYAVMTKNMNTDQREAFDEQLESLFAPDLDDDVEVTDADLNLPAMLPGETVYTYRSRIENKIRRRSQRLRDIEADVLGSDLSLFMAPDEQGDVEPAEATQATAGAHQSESVTS